MAKRIRNSKSGLFVSAAQAADITASGGDVNVETVKRDPLGAVYRERAHVVAALSKLFPASLEQHRPVGDEAWDPEWGNVVVIDLPTGQVTWHLALDDLELFEHLPALQGRVWDGHDTEEKYRRLDALEPVCNAAR